jgi:hypothetical protein
VPRDDDFSAGPYDLSAPPDWNTFPGLYPPLYTQTPDVFFDWVAPFLPEIELRVLLYLIRRTLGFKKQGDQITIDQIANGIVTRDGARLDWGAQLGERSVQRALSGLESKSLIERHKQLDPDRGWRPSYIRLRLCDQSGQDWQVQRAHRAQAPAPPVTREVSGRSPGTRPSGHQAGVPRHASLSEKPPVRRDTYKIEDLQSTVQQETVADPSPEERVKNGYKPETDGIWAAIKSELATQLAATVYKTRVAPTYQDPSVPDCILVRCPDTTTSRWLERQLGRAVAEIAAGLGGDLRPIRFTAAD